MALKKTKSLKGRRMRLTRLDECGVPVIGLRSVIVTAGFITVTYSPEVESGEEFLVKDAWGDFAVNEKDGDRFKWVNLTIEAVEIDPDVLEVTAGANLVDDDGDTIGVTFGTDVTTAAYAIEVWTKAAGSSCGGTPEWGYFVAPFVQNGRIDGDMKIENGVMTLTMVGQGFAAPADWGAGPHGTNPLGTAEFPEGDLFGVVRTVVQPPAVTAGAVALAAP